MSKLSPTIDAPALLAQGEDRQFRQMLYDMLHIQAFMRRAREQLGASVGVSGAGYSILMKVAEAPAEQGVRVSDVAAKLHVSGAFVTRETNQLINQGLIEKRPDPEDGRSVRLLLTDLAWRRVEAIAGSIRSINGDLFGHMSREQFETLSHLMARISDQAETLTTDGITTLTNVAAAE
jgi:DNA-binding MarR family transcriptional regulator